MRLGDTRFVLGKDPHELYLTLFNNFTGHGAAKLMISAVRVLCDNTHRLSEANAEGLIRVCHTGNVEGKLRDAGEVLMAANGYMDAYAKQAERLAATTLSIAQMDKLAATVIDDEGKNAEAKRARLVAYALTDPTTDGFRGNGFGFAQS